MHFVKSIESTQNNWIKKKNGKIKEMTMQKVNWNELQRNKEMDESEK